MEIERGGIALAWVLVHPIATSPLFIWVFRALKISVGGYLRTLCPALSSTVVMAALLIGLRQLVPEDWPLSTRLGLEIAFGGTAYAVSVLLVHHERVQRFLSIVRTVPRVTPG